MGLLRLLYVLTLIHLAKAQNGTSFSYPTFLYNDIKDFLSNNVLFRSSALWINRDNFTSNDCGSFLYGEPIQMRGSNSSAVASFSTSFTFSMSGTNSAGFALAFLPQNRTIGKGGGQLCLSDLSEAGDSSSRFFAVEFDTWKNPDFNDPSNNHVGVNINSMNSSATHNLCGAGVDNCFYLVYNQTWVLDPGYNFTSWIDYDSGAQSLAVFLANGTTMRGVKKPANAIIQVSVDLSDVMNEYMFVGFTGSAAAYKEVKQIKSWSFNTSFTHTGGSPTLGPSNIAPAPSTAGSGSRIAPAPSTGGSGSKSAKLGWTIGAVVVLVMFIMYGVRKLLPVHIFMSFTGGEEMQYRNFVKSLYGELKNSWTFKFFDIKVFMDKKRLEPGKPYKPQIFQELEKMEVGIVMVTPEYFTKKWPMTELISFINSQENNPNLPILPLFFSKTATYFREILEMATQDNPGQVNPEQVIPGQVDPQLQVKRELGQKWNTAWNKRTRREGASIPFDRCQHAVHELCGITGIEYKFSDRGQEDDYIKEIVKEVGKIVRKLIWDRVKDAVSFKKNASRIREQFLIKLSTLNRRQ